MHRRQAIRLAIKDRLLLVPEFGGRVFTSRTYPVDANLVPAALLLNANYGDYTANVIGLRFKMTF